MEGAARLAAFRVRRLVGELDWLPGPDCQVGAAQMRTDEHRSGAIRAAERRGHQVDTKRASR